MPRRPCLEPGCPALTPDTRCHAHQQRIQAAKDQRRPTRRSHAEQQRRRAAVAAQPWCLDCGTITDLTADHLEPVAIAVARGVPVAVAEAGPLIVRCRSCNSRRGKKL